MTLFQVKVGSKVVCGLALKLAVGAVRGATLKFWPTFQTVASPFALIEATHQVKLSPGLRALAAGQFSDY